MKEGIVLSKCSLVVSVKEGIKMGKTYLQALEAMTYSPSEGYSTVGTNPTPNSTTDNTVSQSSTQASKMRGNDWKEGNTESEKAKGVVDKGDGPLSENSKDKMLVMSGPLSEVYTKALQVVYAKKDEATGSTAIESASNDTIIRSGLARFLQMTEPTREEILDPTAYNSNKVVAIIKEDEEVQKELEKNNFIPSESIVVFDSENLLSNELSVGDNKKVIVDTTPRLAKEEYDQLEKAGYEVYPSIQTFIQAYSYKV